MRKTGGFEENTIGQTRGSQTGYQIDPDRLLNRTMFSFRTNHHRVYQKKSKFRKVFIHLNINKIQNVSLARRRDLKKSP